jgi:hypothetical protein
MHVGGLEGGPLIPGTDLGPARLGRVMMVAQTGATVQVVVAELVAQVRAKGVSS